MEFSTKKSITYLLLVACLFLAVCSVALLFGTNEVAFAAGDEAQVEQSDAVGLAQAQASEKRDKAYAAAIVVGIVAAAGAIGMSIAISKAVDGIARQPEAENKIRTSLLLGLVFIETAIIYALIVAILVVFVL